MFQSEFTVLVRLLKQILWTLIFYSILRFEFLIWNWSQWYHTYSWITLFEAFIYGLRFDISALFTISSVVFIAALIPWPFVKSSLKELTLKTTLFILNLPFLLANMGDVEFLHFTGRRFTTDSLFLAKELPGKFFALISTYWGLFSINLILLFIFCWFSFKPLNLYNFNKFSKMCLSSFFEKLNSVFSANNVTFFKRTTQIKPLKSLQDFNPWKTILSRIASSFVFLIVFVIGARGGIQLKPLEMAHAGHWNDIRLTHLITNSSFSLLHSLKKERIEMKKDFVNLDEYAKYLNKSEPIESPTPHQYPWTQHPKNVIVFILESFSLEYMGLPNNDKGYTPFLDSLIPKSFYFPYAFANGRRSIEALPSILAGIPSLMDEPFLTSQYQTTEIPLLGKALNEQGIQSYFFHGGQNGTMFFDEWIARIQFNKYYGAKEYPDSSQNDGTWGIWDQPFLQFMADELDHSTHPFLSVFFSLSSHHPFQLPKDYQGKFAEGAIPILKTIRYTDEALRLFFERAAKSPWFKDTIFIFTADHTSKTFRPTSSTPLAGFRVPIIIYNPQEEKSLTLDKPVQQIDIFPTILELFQIKNIPTPLMSLSLFNQGPRQVALYLDGDYWLLANDLALQKSKGDSEYLFNYKKDPQLQKNLGLNPNNPQQTELENHLKASIQYYNNGLLQNALLKPDNLTH